MLGSREVYFVNYKRSETMFNRSVNREIMILEIYVPEYWRRKRYDLEHRRRNHEGEEEKSQSSEVGKKVRKGESSFKISFNYGIYDAKLKQL